MPIKAAAILASLSSGRDESIVGPGVGVDVGDWVRAGDGAGLGPGVGADRVEKGKQMKDQK